MIRYFDLKEGKASASAAPFIAALGDFDGVHLGHRRVILETVSAAQKKSLSSAVWFFADSPKSCGEKLTSQDEKEKIFAVLGADYSITENFDDVKDLSPEEFVGGYLAEKGCRGVVCGFNFRFGKGASGDVDTLRELCRKAGLSFVSVPPVELGGNIVSSTKIRELIANGDVIRAAEMLGRRYSVRAEVEHGRTLGAKIGFPTINQRFRSGKAMPRRGVYFTYTSIDGVLFPSISDVGSRPTVGGHAYRLETHILDCAADLYGKCVEVFFVKFRRPEMTFENEEALAEAIGEDVRAAREFFGAKGDGENEK